MQRAQQAQEIVLYEDEVVCVKGCLAACCNRASPRMTV